MTNDHSVRSPSTGKESALRPCLAESSSTVRAGMREALEICRSIAEENKLHWARLCDPCNPNDPSKAIYRAKSAACFQVEMDIAALQLPRVKSLTGSEDMDCVFNPHRYAEPGPSEANSTAAPVGELSGPVQSWGVTVTINGIDALTIESACLSGAPNIDEYREAVENCARHLLAFAGRPDAVPEPVAFMFWNEPDTQRHFSQIRETIGNHWTKIAPLYTVPPAPVEAGVREAKRLINDRLEDLATANALYGKDLRLSAPDKIERNNREITWLKDLRSYLALSSQPVVGVDQDTSSIGGEK